MVLDDVVPNLAVPGIVDACVRKIEREEGHNNVISLPPGVTYTIAEDEEVVNLILAIIYVESRFRPDSISKAGAYGLMQITHIAMLEAADFCGLPIVTMDKLLAPAINIKYGVCYLNALMQELDQTNEVLAVWNGGYLTLAKYKKGVSINQETANFMLQVRRIYNICSEEN